jgi:hypothetical protein
MNGGRPVSGHPSGQTPCDPVFGNGIAFLEINPLDRLKLEAYLDGVNQG